MYEKFEALDANPKVISSMFCEDVKEYKIFLFDAYGVFWDGAKIMPETVADMKKLVSDGKYVAVVSNTTQLSHDARKSYAKRGLIEGEHYNEFITSGDVFRDNILNGEAEKFIRKNNKKILKENSKIKIYIFGNPRKELFKDSNYDMVENLNEADAVYLSIPSITDEEKAEILKLNPEYEKYFKLSSLTKEGEPARWDVIDGKAEIFATFLDKFIAKGLPILNANPDATAPEKEKGTDPVVKNIVVRNGQLTDYCRQHGTNVFECGKPAKEIFEFALEKLKNSQEKLKEYEGKLERISLMIGDTRGSDIEGAIRANIDSVLVSTGNESVLEEKNKEYIDGKKSFATYYFKRKSKPSKEQIVAK